MAGAPPSNIDPAELWAIVTQTPLPSRVVDHPRVFPKGNKRAGESICQIEMRVLTQEEMTIAKADAAATTLRVLKRAAASNDAAAKAVVDALDKNAEMTSAESNAYREILALESSCEILFRTCRVPGDLDKPFFPTPATIRKHHTIDEIGVLMTAFLTMMAEASPIGDWDSDEDMEAWLVKLAKGGSAHPLASRSPLALIRALMYLAVRYYGAPSGSSSPSAPQSFTPSTSEPELISAPIADPSPTG